MQQADLERLADELLEVAQTLDQVTKKSWETEDQLNAALTVIQWRKDARNRNPIDRETLRDWTPGKINKRLDVLDAQSSKLTDALIAAGRGYELSSETMKKSDPLALKFRAVHEEYAALRREIDRRYGPGAPSRLPTRGRNPVPPSSRMQPKLSGAEVVRLMRLHGVTIAQLAKRMGIPQTRVRMIREKGIVGAEFVRDWREAITGVDPGSLYGINPVPPSSRARSRNPSRRDEIAQAADLYSRFSGHEAESIGKVPAPRPLKTAIAIGECDGILYTTVRDNRTEKYIHKFRKADRPLLTVAPDGSQIVLVGGNYRFTERGIVDDSDVKNRGIK